MFQYNEKELLDLNFNSANHDLLIILILYVESSNISMNVSPLKF